LLFGVVSVLQSLPRFAAPVLLYCGMLERVALVPAHCRVTWPLVDINDDTSLALAGFQWAGGLAATSRGHH
jgi:hypothetical protein